MTSEANDTAETIRNAPDPLLGVIVDDRYHVEALLGDGGMGVVYSARHVHLGRPVALKVLKREFATKGPSAKRFEREAMAATRLNHHHIVATLDYGRLPNGAPYIAMEKLGGISMLRVLAQCPMAPGRAVGIARQLCLALEAAHEMGVIHRDLKPENIQLVENGATKDYVKVLDFGIAKVSGVTQLTATGHIIGTPRYMAPEQCRGQNVDARADIYSLGVILYELLTGHLPFDGDLATVIRGHLSETPDPMSAWVATPDELHALVQKCMHKDPDERFQSALELDAALESVEALLPGWAPPANWAPTKPDADEPAPARVPTEAMTIDAEAPPRRQMSLTGWIIAGIAIIGIVVVLAFGGRDAEPTPPVVAEGELGTTVTPLPRDPVDEAETPPPAETRAREIRIETDPSGATIHHDGVLIGNTPVSFPRPRSTIVVELSLSGYRPITLSVGPESEAAHSLPLTALRERGRRRPSARADPAPAPMTSQPGPPAMEPTSGRDEPDNLGLLAPPGWK